MSKKYRLEIPEKYLPVVASELSKFQGQILHNCHNHQHLIILGWLTEIKEPLSFEEWFKIRNYPDSDIRLHSITWDAALENQRLGQTVDENKDLQQFNLWFLNRYKPDYSDVWKAALAYVRGQNDN